MFFKEQEDPEIPSFSQDIFIRHCPDNPGMERKTGNHFQPGGSSNGALGILIFMGCPPKIPEIQWGMCPPRNPFPLGGEKSPKTQRKSGNELIINGFPAGSRFGILHAEILMEWLIPKDYLIPALLPWDSTVSAAISQTIPQFPDSTIPRPLSLMAKFVSLTGPFPSARN